MRVLRSCLPAGAVCLLLAGAAARADVKIVSSVTISGQPRPGAAGGGGQPSRQTATAYYKGNKFRTDGSGMILLYDAATDKLLMLDTARKTYTVNAMQKMATQMQPIMSMMKIETGGSVTPGGATRTVAGLPARNYHVALTMRMSLRRPAGSPPQQGMPSGPLLTMKMEGEQWASEAVQVPTRTQRLMTTALLRPAGTMMPGMKPLLDKMAAVRGIPLSSRMTMTLTPAQGMSGAAQRPTVMTIVTEARSVSRQTLPAKLFALPAGYRKVEPGPGMGMPGAGMPGR